MIEQSVVIVSEKGLLIRPVSLLVKKAMCFQSKIKIAYKGKNADLKSLVDVLALNVPKMAAITITVSGNDEKAACEEIVKLLYSF